MGATLSLAVRGARRRAVTIHAVGMMAGSVTMALCLTVAAAIVAPILSTMPAAAGMTAMVVLAAWALKLTTNVGLPYPRRRWQVPEGWRWELPLPFTLGAYGYLLGLGALTDVVLPLYWVLVGATIAAGSLPLAVAAWIVYAMARVWMTVHAASIADAHELPPADPHGPRLWRAWHAVHTTRLVRSLIYPWELASLCTVNLPESNDQDDAESFYGAWPRIDLLPLEGILVWLTLGDRAFDQGNMPSASAGLFQGYPVPTIEPQANLYLAPAGISNVGGGTYGGGSCVYAETYTNDGVDYGVWYCGGDSAPVITVTNLWGLFATAAEFDESPWYPRKWASRVVPLTDNNGVPTPTQPLYLTVHVVVGFSDLWLPSLPEVLSGIEWRPSA